MPRRSTSLPKYRHHKARGLAKVTLGGKDFYLGKFGSDSSRREYDRLVGEWIAAGRPARFGAANDELTVAELIVEYWKWAKCYYVKNGKPTGTLGCIKLALRFLRANYGHTYARKFGPLSLKAVQKQLIEAGHSRRYINDNIDRIRRMFKWAVSEKLVPSSVHEALKSVPGLRKGRSEAREIPPVMPVRDEVVDATLPYLPPVVADMVRFQRLTGCRPGEVRTIRPCSVATSGDVWEYRPESHKTEHHDRERVIFIGPKAQVTLRPYLLRDKTDFCFSPSESERKRRNAAHEQRMTPVNQGNRPGSNRMRQPKRSAGRFYTKDTYRRAIERACDLAFPPPEPLTKRKDETKKQWKERLSPEEKLKLKAWQKAHRWSPNQLRHTAATEIRSRYGLEAAQVTLGHASADVTQVYAERDQAKAREVMLEVG